MVRTGLIFDIKRFSVNDGPGIRTTVFFKGCPLSCWWCHNPESRLCGIEQVDTTRMLNGKEFLHREIIGRWISVQELMTVIEKETVFYETSGGGATFSGGEPLLQALFLCDLATECRTQGIHTCLDTSGYCDPDMFREMIPQFDLFLFDIKTLDRDQHIRYTGVPNDDILKNLDRLDREAGNYIIRIPFIPGVNDDRKSMRNLGEFLQKLRNPLKEIHFLPFHPMAHNKLKRLGMEDKLGSFHAVNEAELHNFVEEFKLAGFTVKIGG